MTEPTELAVRLNQHGQSHVLRWWDDLIPSEQARLIHQLEEIDFASLDRLWRQATDSAAEDESPREKASRAQPPSHRIRLPQSDAERAAHRDAATRGNEILKSGRIGVILVAGGEGTRLQFPHAKGLYPIGPVTGRTLYQWLAEQLAERSRRAGASIPCYVMTSDATHDETVADFARHRHFGLLPDDVRFFRQGTMPVLNLADGRLLMSSRGEIAVSPDGHGGLIRALAREQLVADMQRRGLTDIFYMQVDNPAVIVCDPAFIGFHAREQSELSTKVVAKKSASERMGVLCEVDGVTQIIEYSDMPPEVTSQVDEQGRLRHWAGNTAIHLISVELLHRLSHERELPFHIARKHVPYLSEAGKRVEPSKPDPPNGCKFEKFIFDALPIARRALVVETDRAREFHPLKDRDGENNPASVRAGLTALFTRWLQSAGVEVPAGVDVEISPCVALDADDLASRSTPEIASRLAERPTESGRGLVLE